MVVRWLESTRIENLNVDKIGRRLIVDHLE